MLTRQPTQNLPVNVVVAEPGRILFEPEAAQPFGHIHRSCPETAGPQELLQRRRSIMSRLLRGVCFPDSLRSRGIADASYGTPGASKGGKRMTASHRTETTRLALVRQ